MTRRKRQASADVTSEQITLSPEADGVSGVPAISHGVYSTGWKALPEHVHDTVELCFCSRGSLVFECDGAKHTLLPDNVFLTQPGDRHHLVTNHKGMRMYWLFFRYPRKGIAYPSRREQTLFDEMNGLFRDLLAELLSAGAATAKAPLVCVMAGGTGIPLWKYRRHYWSECVKAGKTKNALDYVWKNMRARLGKDAMREYRYYRGNLGRMKYDEYRRNGWFIGSGVIESGCKTVIGQSFKQSGMIWSLKGAKALLPLRTLHKSNRLEEFFACLVRDLRQVDCAA